MCTRRIRALRTGTRAAATCLAPALALALPAAAQVPPLAPPAEPAAALRTGEYPKAGEGVLPKLDNATAQLLRGMLRRDNPNWPAALKLYFGDRLYDRDLLDWVVFIDPGATGQSTVKQGLVYRDTTVDRVRGKKYVWVLVISTSDLRQTQAELAEASKRADKAREARVDAVGKVCRQHRELQCQLTAADLVGAPESKKDDDPDLTIARRTVDYQRSAPLAALFRAVSKGTLAEAGASPLTDSTVAVKLEPVVDNADKDAPQLYVAQRRFALREDASIVLSVRPASGRKVPRTQAVYRTFVNSGASRFNAGLAVGLTADAPDTSFNEAGLATRRSTEARWNVYLVGTVLAKRPTLPENGFSLGFSLGTNVVSGEILRDLIGAVYLGRLPGDLGLLLGGNYISRNTRVATADTNRFGTREYRVVKPFVGIHFSF